MNLLVNAILQQRLDTFSVGRPTQLRQNLCRPYICLRRAFNIVRFIVSHKSAFSTLDHYDVKCYLQLDYYIRLQRQ